MRIGKTLGSVVLVALVTACGGPRESGKEAEGPAEKAGRELDDAAGNVKETGDKVGEKVGDSISGAADDVKAKLGSDDEKDGGAPPQDNR